jgi:hypothetical protein
MNSFLIVHKIIIFYILLKVNFYVKGKNKFIHYYLDVKSSIKNMLGILKCRINLKQ